MAECPGDDGVESETRYTDITSSAFVYVHESPVLFEAGNMVL